MQILSKWFLFNYAKSKIEICWSQKHLGDTNYLIFSMRCHEFLMYVSVRNQTISPGILIYVKLMFEAWWSREKWEKSATELHELVNGVPNLRSYRAAVAESYKFMQNI